MKPHTLPIKRRPAPKGVLRRLSAVTRNRKQRVAAASANPADFEAEDHSSKISRALTIIFLIHIVAIGLIFVHQHFLDGRSHADEPEAAATPVANEPRAVETRSNLPRLSSGETPYLVRKGDNYTRIAETLGVDEAALRSANHNVDVEAGLILRVPPKRIVAAEPPEITAVREQTPPDIDRGLVEAVPVNASAPPKTQPVAVAPVRSQPVAESAPPARNTSYTVKPGDSIWRISQRFNVNQDALMRANGISDARKMRAGMTLVIPQS